MGNGDHPCTYSIMSSPEECRFCHLKGSDCIKYAYLPLSDEVKRWCSDEEFCKKMTAHWEEKDHWLNRESKLECRRELWNGNRFAELSWFWDPSSRWILPVYCPFCKSVVSSEVVRQSLTSLSMDEEHAKRITSHFRMSRVLY